jgi:hypothetical protein
MIGQVIAELASPLQYEWILERAIVGCTAISFRQIGGVAADIEFFVNINAARTVIQTSTTIPGTVQLFTPPSVVLGAVAGDVVFFGFTWLTPPSVAGAVDVQTSFEFEFA